MVVRIWDLRRLVLPLSYYLEKLIACLQEHCPWALPRVRATLEGGSAAVSS